MTGISTFFGLNTALRGLQAHQRELDVTAHNVANASTDGYSRQQVSLQAVAGIDLASGQVAGGAGALLGGGVDISAYTRARDSFADLQFRAGSSLLGNASTTARKLADAESALNEPGDSGVSKLLSNFWDNWNELATNPESQSARSALVVTGSALADGLHSLDAQISAVQTDATNELAGLIGPNGDVLSNAKAIAALNTQIDQATAIGQTPNDLMDQRDVLIDKLSALGQTKVTTLANGGIQIAFGGVSSPLLVDDQTAAATVPTLTSPGGRIGALMDLTSTGSPLGTLPSYRAALDSIAGTIVSAVNTLHTTAFFDTSGTTAATIKVDASIAANPSLVKTTSVAGSPAGASDVARAIAGLRGGAADTSYAAFVLRVGADSQNATRQETTATATVSAADDRRQSVSGVSLDEEMANMIKFQRGYQASARTMSTIDAMLDTLINRTGTVGL